MYVAVAFLAVPSILFVFHRLSRPPVLPHPTQPVPASETGAGESVAQEAERWLRSQL